MNDDTGIDTTGMPDEAPPEAPDQMSRGDQRDAFMGELLALIDRYRGEFDLDQADIIFCLRCADHTIMSEATFCFLATLDPDGDDDEEDDDDDNEGEEWRHDA